MLVRLKLYIEVKVVVNVMEVVVAGRLEVEMVVVVVVFDIFVVVVAVIVVVVDDVAA